MRFTLWETIAITFIVFWPYALVLLGIAAFWLKHRLALRLVGFVLIALSVAKMMQVWTVSHGVCQFLQGDRQLLHDLT